MFLDGFLAGNCGSEGRFDDPSRTQKDQQFYFLSIGGALPTKKHENRYEK